MQSLLPDFLFRPEPIIWVQQFFGLGHPLPFRILDLLAAVWGVVFAIALALWLWGRDDAYALAAIVVLEALVNLVLNQLFSVPRPSAPEIVKYEQIALGSFPSGHVFTVTVLWGLLWRRDRVPLWLTLLAVLGVALGRLYLGTHYLADVIAGALLGVLLVWVFPRLWEPVRERLAGWSFGALAAAGVLLAAAAWGGLFLLSSKSPFMWNAVGALTGGVLALLLEWRYVRYEPVRGTAGSAALKILLGLVGLVPLLLMDRLTGERSTALGASMLALGAAWALLAVPALLVRLGLSREHL